MKKILYTAFALLIGLLSCKKIDDILTFNINQESEFTVPAAVSLNTPFDIPTPDVATNSSDEFENNNTNASLVKNVLLSKLTLQITNPPDRTFKFLKSVKIYISAQGLPEVMIAKKENIESTSGTLELDTTGEKLDAYIKKETYNLRTEVVTKEIFSPDHDVKAFMTFRVTADPL